MTDLLTKQSDNIDAVFPREHSDALRAFVKGFNASDKRDYRSDAFDDIYGAFQRMGGEWMRHDAVDAYYLARQLEYIRAGVQAAQFPALKSSVLVPMNTDPDEGAESYIARYSEQVGRARVSKNMSGIIPNVDVSVGEKLFPILSILLKYSYTLSEVRASARERKSLPTDRAMRCREQVQREIDAIALIGHADGGLKGLFNQTTGATAVNTYAIQDGGNGKAWSTKTAQQVLTDWHESVSAVITDTNGVEAPNTSVLPLSVFEKMSTRAIGDGTIDTILTAFKRNNAHIKLVESSPYLEAGQAHASQTRMVHYERNSLKGEMILPIPFEQLSPDVTSTETEVVCHARTAGYVMHRPRSMIYVNEV